MKMIEMIKKVRFVTIKMESSKVKGVLDEYLKKAHNLCDEKYEFYIDNSADISDFAVKFENKNLNKEFFEDGEDSGRLLIGAAIDFDLGLKIGTCSVYPDDDKSAEFMMVEVPASLLSN